MGIVLVVFFEDSDSDHVSLGFGSSFQFESGCFFLDLNWVFFWGVVWTELFSVRHRVYHHL